MQVSTQHIRWLLVAASQKASTTMDHAGFGRLSVKISEQSKGIDITQRYLHENLYSRLVIAEKEGQNSIGLNMAYLHTIAQYLEYDAFESFLAHQTQQIPAQLRTCFGNWYSYVRDSSGMDLLLRSPVRMFEENGQAQFKLRGRDRLFTGTLEIKSGGLFVLLEDQDRHKEMHEVYKIGLLRHPHVLLGVFSAFSSLGHPVAGRKLLLRTNKAFDDLEIGRHALSDEPEPSAAWPLEILKYFRSYEGNYIRITGAENVV